MARVSRPEIGLVVLRILLGTFFTFEGLDKAGWMTNPGLLAAILGRWAETATPLTRWYLDTVAIPGVPVFARLIFVGEVAAGLALIVGFWTRAAAIVTALMVLNIHFAHSALFQYSFLSKGDGLPVLGGLLALAIGGARLPWSLERKSLKRK